MKAFNQHLKPTSTLEYHSENCLYSICKKWHQWPKDIKMLKITLPVWDMHILIWSMMARTLSWQTQIFVAELYLLSLWNKTKNLAVSWLRNIEKNNTENMQWPSKYHLTKERRCSQYNLWHSARIWPYSFLEDLLSISSSKGLSCKSYNS